MLSSRAHPRRSAWVLALALDQLAAWGVLYYAYPVLAPPIARDLALSSRWVAAAFSCTLLVSALRARGVGQVLDRAGARRVLIAGAVVGAPALVVLATAREGIALLLGFAALGVAHSLSLYEPAFRAIVDWFPRNAERSRALLVLTSVAGLASTMFLPLTARLVDACGWRAALLALAALFALVTLPVRLALPPRAPCPDEARDGALAPVPAPEGASGVHLLGTGFALQSFASTGAGVCLLGHLTEQGSTLDAAALVAGLLGASQVPARLLLAPLQRAVPTALRLPLLFGVQAAGLALIGVASGPLLVLAVLCFGAAQGSMTPERAAVVLERFGPAGFGAQSGQIAQAALLARAGAPFVVEVLHGVTSYATVFGVLAAGVCAGAGVVRAATRPCPATVVRGHARVLPGRAPREAA